MRALIGIMVLAGGLLASANAAAQTVQFVPGSTTPRVQLTGDEFQIVSNELYFITPTPSLTRSRSGVLGTDLGFPVAYGSKFFLLFGDTIGVYDNGGKLYVSRGANGVGDSIGYLEDGDFDQCRYVAGVDAELARGVAAPVVDAAACPVLRFLNDPARTPDGHVFKPIVISGLQPEESQGTFRVPSGGVIHNDRLYLFYISRMQDEGDAGHFQLQSLIARSDQSPGEWSDAAPASFRRLYTVSSHAPMDDAANPPPLDGESGRFISNAPYVMTAGAIAAGGFRSGLPASLQSAEQVVFVWGSGWRGHTNNVYLAAFALADIDAGMAKWFYYKGDQQWSANELEAAPVVTSEDFAEHSAVWNSALRRFVMMDSAGGRVRAHFSTTPWGPWSAPSSILSRTDPWPAKLLHRPGLDPIVQSAAPIHNRDGSPFPLPNDDIGAAYAPYLFDKFTSNSDGSVTLYYMLSTWNPYQAFLVSSRFRIGPAAGASINARALEELTGLPPVLRSATPMRGTSGESLLALDGTGFRDRRDVRVAIGGVAATIVHAGASPADGDSDRLIVQVPPGLAHGIHLEVVAIVNGRATEPLRIAIR